MILEKLRRQTKQHLKRFPCQARDIGDRKYLRFADYLRWRGRRASGDLKRGLRRGLVVSGWNRWVETSGDRVASLAGVAVARLRWYLECYQYHVCPDSDGLTEGRRLREMLLETLRGWRPASNSTDRFYRSVATWKVLVDDFIGDIYSLRWAVDAINRRYFDGQQALFPATAQEFSRLLANIEDVVEDYNQDLAGELGRQEAASGEESEVPNPHFFIDVAALKQEAAQIVSERARYLVDMARAESLNALGENEAAVTIIERHV